jgi:hypothetical protein
MSSTCCGHSDGSWLKPSRAKEDLAALGGLYNNQAMFPIRYKRPPAPYSDRQTRAAADIEPLAIGASSARRQPQAPNRLMTGRNP